MKKAAKFIAILIPLFLLAKMIPGVWADDCSSSCNNFDDCKEKIEKCQKALEMSVAATKPHEETVLKMESDVKSLEGNLVVVEEDLIAKEKKINDESESLAGQEDTLSKAVREFYKKNKTYANLGYQILSGTSIGMVTRVMFYQQMVVNEEKRVIVDTVMMIKSLEQKKKELEDNKKWLATKKIEIEKQMAPIKDLVANAKSYQDTLSSQIAGLTERQRAIISGRIESLNLPSSLGAGPLYCTDDRNTDPGFSPAFAFFTFGIPHRVGLNQYGAFGRAQANEKYDEILHAYYNFDSYQNVDTNINIKVNDSNEIDKGNIIWSGSLNDYVKRIYEVPSDWPIDSLKAQIIAIRSYVLASTNNGAMSICANQYCQVFKTDPKGGTWDQAVDDTQGNVMIQGGQPIKAWFSSTDGGYTFTAADVWGSERSWTKRLRDTNGDINSFSDLFSKAYDKDSPCFYSAQGFRREYNKSAWLKSEEVADIVNVILLARKDSSTREHLYQVDKPNPSGTDTWDANRVRQELGSGAFSSISDVLVTGVDFGTGRTTQITVKGDAGEKTFDGSEFSGYFNARSPANILIVGPLFNIEKK